VANKQQLDIPVQPKLPKKPFFCEDITRGRYINPVRCVNNIDDTAFPKITFISTSFSTRGVPRILVEHDIETNEIILPEPKGCSCKFDCTDRIKCECYRLMHGKAAYDENGRILLHKNEVIYECNKNCTCFNSCRNRVIQKDSPHKFELFKTEKKGWALRTLTDIPRGKFVSAYYGEIITQDEASIREDESYHKNNYNYFFEIDCGVNPDYLIDATHKGNYSRFINHSCDPNLVTHPYLYKHHFKELHGITFFAKYDIKAGDELTLDYGMDILQADTCYCGSPNCRKVFK